MVAELVLHFRSPELKMCSRGRIAADSVLQKNLLHRNTQSYHVGPAAGTPRARKTYFHFDHENLKIWDLGNPLTLSPEKSPKGYLAPRSDLPGLSSRIP